MFLLFLFDLAPAQNKDSDSEDPGIKEKSQQLREQARQQDSAAFFKKYFKYYSEARSGNKDLFLINCYSSAGIYYYYKENYDEALKYFDSACFVARKKKMEMPLSNNLMNRGACFFTNKQYSLALRDYLECEQILMKHRSESIGGLMGNIALLYQEIGDLQSAKVYLYKSYPYLQKAKDPEGLAKFYNNLGLIYKKEKNLNAADSIFRQGLRFCNENGLDRDKSDILYNLVEILSRMKRYKEAKVFCEELLTLTKTIRDRSWMKMVVLEMSKLELQLKDKQAAKKFLEQAEALPWADQETALLMLEDYYSGIAEVYYGLGQFEKSATAFWTMDTMRSQKSNLELMNTQQLRFKYQKQQDSISFAKQKEIDDLYNEKERQAAEHQLSRQRLFTVISIIILLVIGFFSATLFRANRQKEAANAELKEQKRLVSEKNTEITDSIQYSLRIQESLLPSQRKLSHYLPRHFLIYLPKDIVSGDFYWLQDIGNHEILLAVADCTGHGVPGAIISALSIQQLNGISRTVKEPAKILQRLNKKLKENLKQEDDGISKDGLDICLCRISFVSKKIVYAGANRNLWIFGKDGLKQEVKATKAGIAGYTSSEQEYAQHEIMAEENDYFVMSSDGFADQFGGTWQKKITTKYFKNWIASGPADFDKKGDDLKQKFISWKQNQEQIDDVCVMAFSPFSPAKT